MTELDMERLPHEITRALEAQGYSVELMDPGLRVIPGPVDMVVVDRYGDALASVPMYRLREIDSELVRDGAAAALDTVPLHMADQLAAGINAGEVTVNAPPNSEWVYVHVGEFGLMAAHRCCVVQGWPETDRTEEYPA